MYIQGTAHAENQFATKMLYCTVINVVHIGEQKATEDVGIRHVQIILLKLTLCFQTFPQNLGLR